MISQNPIFLFNPFAFIFLKNCNALFSSFSCAYVGPLSITFDNSRAAFARSDLENVTNYRNILIVDLHFSLLNSSDSSWLGLTTKNPEVDEVLYLFLFICLSKLRVIVCVCVCVSLSLSKSFYTCLLKSSLYITYNDYRDNSLNQDKDKS